MIEFVQISLFFFFFIAYIAVVGYLAHKRLTDSRKNYFRLKEEEIKDKDNFNK
ncbi:hypothetical protein [Bacillus stercoris]|uniref:hypothetical protein n=1 Tax=Bacillus stercoris TaxID=2054641 RepID=UPI003CF87363